jgi:enoyl-CoA hydratase/carnithine racemase
MPPRNGGGLGGASFRHLAHSGQAKSIEKQPYSVCGITIPHLLDRPLASFETPASRALRIRKAVDDIKIGPHPERERSEQSMDALFSSKIDQGSPEAAMDGTAAATAVRSENTPVLLEERTEGVLRLVMNRPAQRNALSVALMSALQESLERAAADQACRVIIIAGAGPAFCAGHDLRELRSEDDVSEARRETYRRIFAQCSALMLQIVRLPKPVIAEVHGIATAAGCQLVATCDLAVAAAEARFATPGVNIGLFCSTPMVALSRAIGRKPAMEMLLTAELIDAASAKALGLVNRVVPAAELSAATAELASQIAGKSALTLKIGKEAFYRQAELGLADAYKYASEVMTTNMLAQDAAEGIDAFLEKRPPVWRDA